MVQTGISEAIKGRKPI